MPMYGETPETDVSDQENGGEAKEDEKPHAVRGKRQQYAGTDGGIPAHFLHDQRHEHADRCADQQIEQHCAGHDQAERHAAIKQIGEHSGHATPDQPVEQADGQFLAYQAPSIVRRYLTERERADDQRGGLVAGISGDARNDRHQRGQGHQLLDGSFKSADHARSEKCGAKVDRQPQPAVFRAFPHRSEDVLLLEQAGVAELFGFAALADEVDDYVHRDAPDQPVRLVDHRCGYQVIALEGLRGLLRLVIRRQGDEFGVHHFAHQHLRVGHDQPVDRQDTLDGVAAVDHEHLVGMVGQFVYAPQITQYDFQGDVVAHGDHVEVHQCADRVFRIGHGGAQLLTLFDGHRMQHVVNHVLRQVGNEVCDFIRVELFGGGDQLVRVHVLDERSAHRVRDFEQDFAVALGLDQVPDDQSLFERQRFQDVGNVGRMEPVEFLLQLGKVLLVDE